MSRQQPAAIAQTNSREGSIIDVQIRPKRKVSYLFNTAASGKKELTLPFVVAVNDEPLKDFDSKPRLLKCNGGKIEVMVNAGSKVSLFLNSDAHPAYRNNPVYAITPNDHDVVVAVTEKKGKHADTDTPVFSHTVEDSGKLIDHYTTHLTGDIWMKISHRYTTDEASALIPVDTDPAIRNAVLSIYQGLASKQVIVNVPARAATKDAESLPALRITASFINGDRDNANSNIAKFSYLSDGAPRVHPLCYVALLNAAAESGVSRLHINSGWRPLLGSIVHRAGLGLDVDYVEDKDKKVHLNREELTEKNGRQLGNVSDEEKRLFNQYTRATAELETRKAELKAAETAYNKGKTDPDKVVILTIAKNVAKDRLDHAQKKERATKKAWNIELNNNEPQAIQALRNRLSRCSCVSQVFDPWYMDHDTHDPILPVPNGQRTDNEKLHDNHLHITIDEPLLL